MTKKDDTIQGELVTREAADIAHRDPTEVGALLQLAVTEKLDVDKLERLVSLFERQQEREARAEFAAALDKFQDDVPSVPKGGVLGHLTQAGTRKPVTYSRLEEDIMPTIRGHLHANGLSVSWDTAENDKGDGLVVTCRVQHINGQFREAHFPCPYDARAKTSVSQQRSAALTVARRQSLVQALGLVSCDTDTDDQPTEAITAAQAADIRALMEEVGADEAKMLALAGAAKVDEIAAGAYKMVIRLLEAKRK